MSAIVLNTHLETQIAETRRAEAELRGWKQRYDWIAQASGQIIYDYEIPTGEITWSGQVEPVLGFALEEMNGGADQWMSLLHPDDQETMMNLFETLPHQADTFDLEYRFRCKNGDYRWIHDRGLFFLNEDRRPVRMLGAMQDVSRQKQSEMERERMQQEIIAIQQQTLKELATPIIPIMDRIIVMPLIGNSDAQRARDITRTHLQGISHYQARAVILDITGVPLVDSNVAAHLNKTIQAIRLKGARSILTGISDSVAETVIDLGLDWSEIESMRDLQSGLIAALENLGMKLSLTNGRTPTNGH